MDTWDFPYITNVCVCVYVCVYVCVCVCSELELEQKRQQEEDDRLALEDKYYTQEDTSEKLQMKLKRLWEKQKHAKEEIDDLQAEFQQEREDMLQTIRELTKENILKNLIVSHFIPDEVCVSVNMHVFV